MPMCSAVRRACRWLTGPSGPSNVYAVVTSVTGIRRRIAAIESFIRGSGESELIDAGQGHALASEYDGGRRWPISDQ